jgi:hypothetical protein
MVSAIFWSVADVATKANEMYSSGIQQQVETSDNIGKMLTIDVETGEYFIDKTGVEGMMFLKAKRPTTRLFTLKIGYSAAVGFGGFDGKLSR